MTAVNTIICDVVDDENEMETQDKVNHVGDTFKAQRNLLFKKIIIL